VYVGEPIATTGIAAGELRGLVTQVRRIIEANLPLDTTTTTDALRVQPFNGSTVQQFKAGMGR
jgi:hypothetical protein